MARLPNSDQLIFDVRKLEDYCLSPAHPLAYRGRGVATGPTRRGKNVVDRAAERERAAFRNLLGAVMDAFANAKEPSLLDVVALLADRPADALARGQVGTVVETLPDNAVLVEFSDDQGHPYAVVPCGRSDLLILHYEPQAA